MMDWMDSGKKVCDFKDMAGAFRRQYGPVTQDQTLFGLVFHQAPKQGGYFEAGGRAPAGLAQDCGARGTQHRYRGQCGAHHDDHGYRIR